MTKFKKKTIDNIDSYIKNPFDRKFYNDYSGIYTIQNIVNNKIYVGASVKVIRRLLGHKNDLIANRHKNLHLQKSFNKYGLNNFKFDLLMQCNKDYIYSFENYWCNLLNAHNYNYGYNIRPTCPTGKGCLDNATKKKLSKAHMGKIVPQQTKDNMSKAQLRRKLPQFRSDEAKRNIANSNIKRSKPIVQMDLQGNFIKEWMSRMEASKKLNIHYSAICNATLGIAHTAGGYKWKFK